MPAPTSISSEKLFRLIGTPQSPTIVDIRDEASSVTGLVPASVTEHEFRVAASCASLIGRSVVVVCEDGRARGHCYAALLRNEGIVAETLDGGVAGWEAAGMPLVRPGMLPSRNAHGQTVWVTRARPKVDRIACPWLIRRFVDPFAQFLFVPPTDVEEVALQVGGAAFDIESEHVFWTHRGDLCTFDVMVDEFGLARVPALKQLAVLVRGADTARPDLAPEAAGLLAASLGLSRMFADDLAQIDAGMLIYDAFYRWARDATSETHTWVQHQQKGVRA